MEAFLTHTNLNSLLPDLICAGIFLIFAFIGGKRGFCKCIMPIVVAVCSFVGAIFGSRMLEDQAMKIVFPLVDAKLTEGIEKMVSGIEVPSKFVQALINGFDISKGAEKLAQALCQEIVHLALFILIFILAIIVLKLLGKIIGKITDLPGIRAIDGFLGFIYGLLLCLALAFIAIRVLNLIKPEFLKNYEAGTYILSWLMRL